MIISRKILERAKLELSGKWEGVLPRVSIDTRTIKTGELFWAISGDRFNGHDYIEKAFENGASIAAVDREWYGIFGQQYPDKTFFIMDDTLAGLQSLAEAVMETIPAGVICVTGSNGKTTVKEMISAGLSTSGKTSKTKGNLNNHIGVPLTILNLDGDEKYAVIELGANHTGEIELLSALAKPDYGIITNISEAHLGEFGGIENVQKAKGELFEALFNDGIAIVNLMDDRVREVAAKNQRKSGFTLYDIPSDWSGSIYSGTLTGLDSWSRPTLSVEGMSVKLDLPGKHFAELAIGAYAVAVEAGCEPDVALQEIAKVSPLPGRGRIVSLGRSVELLDDSYNANPASIEAALATLSRRPGYRIAVIGDVFELGEFEEDEHRRIGRFHELGDIDKVYFVGPRMSWAAEEADLSGHPWTERFDPEEMDTMAERILEDLPEGSGIVVKGSRATGLDKLVDILENKSGLRE